MRAGSLVTTASARARARLALGPIYRPRSAVTPGRWHRLGLGKGRVFGVGIDRVVVRHQRRRSCRRAGQRTVRRGRVAGAAAASGGRGCQVADVVSVSSKELMLTSRKLTGRPSALAWRTSCTPALLDRGGTNARDAGVDLSSSKWCAGQWFLPPPARRAGHARGQRTTGCHPWPRCISCGRSHGVTVSRCVLQRPLQGAGAGQRHFGLAKARNPPR